MQVSYRRLCDHACDLAERAAFGNKLQRVPAATAAAECGGGGSNIPSGGAHDGGGIKSTARNNDEDQLEKLLEETLETVTKTVDSSVYFVSEGVVLRRGSQGGKARLQGI